MGCPGDTVVTQYLVAMGGKNWEDTIKYGKIMQDMVSEKMIEEEIRSKS